jgi:PBSX family phage terminase large subunit
MKSKQHIMMSVNYTASPTMKKFHQDETFVRALMGPIGSGKSVACCMEMLLKSFAQEPNKDGIRKTRWVVARNTYRELMDTTIQTFFDWFPEQLGVFKKMDLKFSIQIPLADNTLVQTEFLFRAFDKPDDIKKLLSLEVTGGWINEAREVPKQIMDMLIGRLGRYPNMRDGGPTWHGLILDTNPPDSDHWWYKLFEVDCPESYALFKQPSGLSQEAENIKNLPKGYYTKMQAGKDKEWINVYVHGMYGFVQDGKPVFPEYKDDVHHTDEEIKLDQSKPIYIGIDFGLTPAAVLGQETASGRWLIFDEFVVNGSETMGAKTFGRLLNTHLNRHYSGYAFEIYGDPAGDSRAQTDEVTPFQILQTQGIVAYPTYTNDFIIRREAVAATLTRLDSSANSGFVIGPKAVMIRKAMAGGYKYRRMQVSGGIEKFMDKPDKGKYSHVADALQYLMLGAGEGGKLIQSANYNDKIDYSNSDRAIL